MHKQVWPHFFTKSFHLPTSLHNPFCSDSASVTYKKLSNKFLTILCREGVELNTHQKLKLFLDLLMSEKLTIHISDWWPQRAWLFTGKGDITCLLSRAPRWLQANRVAENLLSFGPWTKNIGCKIKVLTNSYADQHYTSISDK